MKKFIVFISLLMVVLSFNAYAVDKVAQTGVKMLDVAAGARACGMGEAFTVLGQDATALFYNPAGIGKIDASFDLSAGGTQWIADINYLYLAGAFNGDVWGNFGFSILVPDYGEFYGARITEGGAGYENTGIFHVHAFCAGVAYARSFTDKFTVGLQAKYVSQHLGSSLIGTEWVGTPAVATDTIVRENEISTPAFDFGLLFYPGFMESFAFGMSVRNFSPRVAYEEVGFECPITFALGISVDAMELFGDYPDYNLYVAFEGLHPRDWEEQFHLGAEFAYKGMLFLRAGYKFNYYTEGLNAGVGISLGGVRLDYSYSANELYDMVQRASAGFSF